MRLKASSSFCKFEKGVYAWYCILFFSCLHLDVNSLKEIRVSLQNKQDTAMINTDSGETEKTNSNCHHTVLHVQKYYFHIKHGFLTIILVQL